jgi:hypothetical protein
MSATVRRRLLRDEDSDGMSVFEHKPQNRASFQANYIYQCLLPQRLFIG